MWLVSTWKLRPSSKKRKSCRAATTVSSSLLKVLYLVSVLVSFLLKKERGCHSPPGDRCCRAAPT